MRTPDKNEQVSAMSEVLLRLDPNQRIQWLRAQAAETVIVNRVLDLLDSSWVVYDCGKMNQRRRGTSRMAWPNSWPADAGAPSFLERLRVEQDLGPACIIAQCV